MEKLAESFRQDGAHADHITRAAFGDVFVNDLMSGWTAIKVGLRCGAFELYRAGILTLGPYFSMMNKFNYGPLSIHFLSALARMDEGTFRVLSSHYFSYSVAGREGFNQGGDEEHERGINRLIKRNVLRAHTKNLEAMTKLLAVLQPRHDIANAMKDVYPMEKKRVAGAANKSGVMTQIQRTTMIMATHIVNSQSVSDKGRARLVSLSNVRASDVIQHNIINLHREAILFWKNLAKDTVANRLTGQSSTAVSVAKKDRTSVFPNPYATPKKEKSGKRKRNVTEKRHAVGMQAFFHTQKRVKELADQVAAGDGNLVENVRHLVQCQGILPYPAQIYDHAGNGIRKAAKHKAFQLLKAYFSAALLSRCPDLSAAFAAVLADIAVSLHNMPPRATVPFWRDYGKWSVDRFIVTDLLQGLEEPRALTIVLALDVAELVSLSKRHTVCRPFPSD
jgi:hypothetical protein